MNVFRGFFCCPPTWAGASTGAARGYFDTDTPGADGAGADAGSIAARDGCGEARGPRPARPCQCRLRPRLLGHGPARAQSAEFSGARRVRATGRTGHRRGIVSLPAGTGTRAMGHGGRLRFGQPGHRRRVRRRPPARRTAAGPAWRFCVTGWARYRRGGGRGAGPAPCLRAVGGPDAQVLDIHGGGVCADGVLRAAAGFRPGLGRGGAGPGFGADHRRPRGQGGAESGQDCAARLRGQAGGPRPGLCRA